MKKFVISILSLALVLQSSVLVLARDLGKIEVPTNMQASQNSSGTYQDGPVEITKGQSIGLKATVDMSGVRDKFNEYVAQAKATIDEIADEAFKALALQKLGESKVTGRFVITLNYSSDITLPSKLASGGDLSGFSSAVQRIFQETNREVVKVDDSTSALKITIEVAGPVQDDGTRPGYCTEKEMEENLTTYLPDLEFTATGITISETGSYIFSGEMTGETTVTGNNQTANITYTAVQEPGHENPSGEAGDISVSVKVNAAQNNNNSSRPGRPGTLLPGPVISGGTDSDDNNGENNGEDNPSKPVSVASFTDISAQDWYYESVDYVLKKGLMNGTSKNSFSPNEDTSRGMITTILWRMAGSPSVEGAGNYLDVSEDAYYAMAIAWANQAGVVTGYGDGNFGPDDSVTREQMAAILNRYARYKGANVSHYADLSQYQDAEAVSDWARQNMEWAVGAGLIKGKEDANLDPANSAVRAETAAILMRYCENIVK